MARGTDAASVARDARGLVPFLLVLALLAMSLWAARWAIAPGHVAGDTIWYGRQALVFAGHPADDALREAATFMVEHGRGSGVQGWIDVVGRVDPRYEAIFAARPLFPLAASFLVPAVGLGSLEVVVAAAAVALALVLGAFALRVTGSRTAAVLVVALAFVLPSGHWLAFLYADALMLAIWTAGLASMSMACLDPRGRWLLVLAVSFVLLVLAKPANAGVLGLTGVAVGLVGFVADRPRRRRFVSIGLLSAGLLGVQAMGSALLGLPSAETSVQDFLTHHFAEPNATDPWLRLARFVAGHADALVSAAVPNPVAAVLMVAGLVPLVRRSWSLPWVVGALLSVGLVLLHPVASEVPRLIAPVWVSTAFGIGVGGVAVARRIQARRPLPAPVAEV